MKNITFKINSFGCKAISLVSEYINNHFEVELFDELHKSFYDMIETKLDMQLQNEMYNQVEQEFEIISSKEK